MTLALVKGRSGGFNKRKLEDPHVNAWWDSLAVRPAFKTAAVSWPDESRGGYEEVGLGTKVR